MQSLLSAPTTSQANGLTTFSAPLYVAWEITHRCNARCLHCYSASGPTADCTTDLSTKEGMTVIDQLADAGVLVLAFSGGEPMMRKDWTALVAHAVSRGLRVNVGTNGSTVTEQRANQLKDLGVHSITVSLDSSIPGVHDYFRQYPGLFTMAKRAIERLVRRDLRVVVGYTPTRINWKDGLGVVALAHEMGATAVNLSEYVPAGRGTIDLALKPEELRAVLHQWIELREEYRGRLDIIWHDCRVGMLVPESERRKYVGCGAGRLVARITPDGGVTPCVFLSTPIGSLRTESFQDMWSGSQLLSKFRQREGFVSGNCGDCAFLPTCGGCRAVAFAYSGGDPLAGDPHCWIRTAESLEMAPLSEGEALPV